MADKELTPDFRKVFDVTPSLLLILLPDSPKFTIVAVNDAFLKTTMTVRDNILGKGVFEVFPNNPEDSSGAISVQNLKDSLEQVIGKRLPNKMKMLRYDIRRAEEDGGGFEKRFWSPINIPILGDDGQVINILNNAQDITSFISSKNIEGAQNNADQFESEIIRYTKSLQEEKRNIERNYELLLESVKNYAIYTIDSKGIITSWYSAAEAIKGYRLVVTHKC